MSKKPYRLRITDQLSALAKDAELKIPVTWDVGEDFAEMADDVALDMSRDKPISSIAMAFKEADLDPANPHNWYYVLRVFADVHYFHFRSEAKVHTPAKQEHLWNCLREIISRTGLTNLSEACRQLVRDHAADFAGGFHYWRDVINTLEWNLDTFRSDEPPDFGGTGGYYPPKK